VERSRKRRGQKARPDGDPRELGRGLTGAFESFAGAVGRRLEQGRTAYGDRSFSKEPTELLREIEEELLDVCAWSFILWHRIRRMREIVEGAAITDTR
jgi:hypothetical protein